MKYFFLLISCLTIGLLYPIQSSATGIQVSPSRLDIVLPGKPETREIVVVNPTADVQIFEVYPDDFAENIYAEPASFTLEAGARKTVTLKFSPQGQKSDSSFSTSLSVVGSPLATSRVQTRTGVKLPLDIKIEKAKGLGSIPPWAWALGGAALVIAASVVRKYWFPGKNHSPAAV